jgi:hypothetical protein
LVDLFERLLSSGKRINLYKYGIKKGENRAEVYNLLTPFVAEISWPAQINICPRTKT